MAKKINPLAINISSTRLEFCSSNSSSPASFPFPPTSISEMEIVNKEELKSRLQAFFSEHQIHAEPVVLILGESMYYSKDYLTSAPPSQEEVQKFLDLVPFASISFRIYRLPVGHRLVVINREFYEGFKTILLSLGFSIVSVVPSFIITGPGTAAAFSSQTCLLINRKMDSILENSFGGQEVSPNATANSRHFIEQHKTMVAVLTILFILACPVIIYFVYQQQKASISKLKKKPVAAAVVRKPTATPTPTINPVAALKLEQYKVQLLNGSGTPGLAASLEAKFKSIGFAQVTTGNFPKSIKTEITFKPTIGEEIRELVKSVLSPQFKSISIKDSSTSQFDISITTGNLN